MNFHLVFALEKNVYKLATNKPKTRIIACLPHAYNNNFYEKKWINSIGTGVLLFSNFKVFLHD
jgi:hypothetical protein